MMGYPDPYGGVRNRLNVKDQGPDPNDPYGIKKASGEEAERRIKPQRDLLESNYQKAPSSPIDGDMWYDGTNLKFRVGGTSKTVV